MNYKTYDPNTGWKTPISLVSGVSYNAAGQPTSMSYLGYTETRAYNDRLQLTRLTAAGAGLPGMDMQYWYADPNNPATNNGRVTRQKDWISGGDVTYVYDDLQRLISATTAGPEWGQSYTYDGFQDDREGNRDAMLAERESLQRNPVDPPKMGTTAPTQPCFDTAAFASTLDQNARPASKGQCARHVRLALEGGGINMTGRPNAAGDYGPFLQSKVFTPVSVQGYTPQMGDIAVFGKTDVQPYGHVTGFDAVNWVSAFIQKHMNHKAPATAGPLTVYRNQNPCGR